jgi:hypothetical protein
MDRETQVKAYEAFRNSGSGHRTAMLWTLRRSYNPYTEEAPPATTEAEFVAFDTYLREQGVVVSK